MHIQTGPHHRVLHDTFQMNLSGYKSAELYIVKLHNIQYIVQLDISQIHPAGITFFLGQFTIYP